MQPNSGATVWLPDENEWFKAAYYDPANGTYSGYATQSDTAPGNVIGTGTNQANYSSGLLFSVTQSGSYNSIQNYLTAVGSFTDSASYYGTYDQSGEVFSWMDAAESYDPILRGGAWNDGDSYDVSSYERYVTGPTLGNAYTGFRVASIPEPNAQALILAGVVGLTLVRDKRFNL